MGFECSPGSIAVFNPTRVACEKGVCTDSQCCDKVCSSFDCPSYYPVVEDADRIRCGYSGCTEDLCCVKGETFTGQNAKAFDEGIECVISS